MPAEAAPLDRGRVRVGVFSPLPEVAFRWQSALQANGFLQTSLLGLDEDQVAWDAVVIHLTRQDVRLHGHKQQRRGNQCAPQKHFFLRLPPRQVSCVFVCDHL